MSRILWHLKQWFRSRILQQEVYMSADIGMRESEILVLKHHKRTGRIEIISDYYNETPILRDIDKQIRELAKKYSPKCIVKDIIKQPL